MSQMNRKQVEEVRDEIKAFFGSADGMATVAAALQILMQAARDGAVVMAGKQGEEVIDSAEEAAAKKK